jgi:hypothetical protein
MWLKLRPRDCPRFHKLKILVLIGGILVNLRTGRALR